MINIRTCPGNATAKITDMTNAGRRGRRCKVIRFHGLLWEAGVGDKLHQAAKLATDHIMAILASLDASYRYEDASAILRRAVDLARGDGIPESYVAWHDEEIRGVDVPLPPLSAGTDKAMANT